MSSDSEKTTTPVGKRTPRGSLPILILAALFLASTFLAWYFTWFGRNLSEADITRYLADTKNPRHVQHALLQIQQRMERKDRSVRNWYPQLLTLTDSPEVEYRLTVAWLLGFDNQNSDFHQALSKLLLDSEPIVRRNAALALIRFNDNAGRRELVAILEPYSVKSKLDGSVASTLREGAEIARGSLLDRIQSSDGKVLEVRAPLAGRIARIFKGNGTEVKVGDDLLSINSDEESVYEALRGLALIGQADDVPTITNVISGSDSDRVRRQATLAVETILSRKD